MPEILPRVFPFRPTTTSMSLDHTGDTYALEREIERANEWLVQKNVVAPQSPLSHYENCRLRTLFKDISNKMPGQAHQIGFDGLFHFLKLMNHTSFQDFVAYCEFYSCCLDDDLEVVTTQAVNELDEEEKEEPEEEEENDPAEDCIEIEAARRCSRRRTQIKRHFTRYQKMAADEQMNGQMCPVCPDLSNEALAAAAIQAASSSSIRFGSNKTAAYHIKKHGGRDRDHQRSYQRRANQYIFKFRDSTPHHRIVCKVVRDGRKLIFDFERSRAVVKEMNRGSRGDKFLLLCSFDDNVDEGDDDECDDAGSSMSVLMNQLRWTPPPSMGT